MAKTNVSGAAVFGLVIAILAVAVGALLFTAMLIQIGMTGAGVDISYWDTVALTAGVGMLVGGRASGSYNK